MKNLESINLDCRSKWKECVLIESIISLTKLFVANLIIWMPPRLHDFFLFGLFSQKCFRGDRGRPQRGGKGLPPPWDRIKYSLSTLTSGPDPLKAVAQPGSIRAGVRALPDYPLHETTQAILTPLWLRTGNLYMAEIFFPQYWSISLTKLQNFIFIFFMPSKLQEPKVRLFRHSLTHSLTHQNSRVLSLILKCWNSACW